MPAYSHFDYYLRSIVTAVLALGILIVAGYLEITGKSVNGPFKEWAALIIGVYFGAHVSTNGSGARRRQAEAELTPPPTHPAEGVPTVVVTATSPPQPTINQ